MKTTAIAFCYVDMIPNIEEFVLPGHVPPNVQRICVAVVATHAHSPRHVIAKILADPPATVEGVFVGTGARGHPHQLFVAECDQHVL